MSWGKESAAWRSLPQMPHARTLASTCPGPGTGSETSSTRSSFPRKTTARITPTPESFAIGETIPWRLEDRLPARETRTVPRLLLATNNPGKVAELRRLLATTGYELVTPAELGIALDVEESGVTYAENAAAKARAAARAAGCLALADDSGIEVDALGGRPGVHSARYGGAGLDDRARVELLLRELEGVPNGRRTARFRAVVVIAAPDGSVLQTFEGVAEGSIAREPRGTGGFGYDPIFVVRGLGKTMAELTPEEKDAVSHRGQALRAAAAWLRARLEHG